jgi:hypothetical protein
MSSSTIESETAVVCGASGAYLLSSPCVSPLNSLGPLVHISSHLLACFSLYWCISPLNSCSCVVARRGVEGVSGLTEGGSVRCGRSDLGIWTVGEGSYSTESLVRVSSPGYSTESLVQAVTCHTCTVTCDTCPATLPVARNDLAIYRHAPKKESHKHWQRSRCAGSLRWRLLRDSLPHLGCRICTPYHPLYEHASSIES